MRSDEAGAAAAVVDDREDDAVRERIERRAERRRDVGGGIVVMVTADGDDARPAADREDVAVRSRRHPQDARGSGSERRRRGACSGRSRARPAPAPARCGADRPRRWRRRAPRRPGTHPSPRARGRRGAVRVLGRGREPLRFRGRLGLGRLGGVELLGERGHLLLRLLERERHPVEREDGVGALEVTAEHRRELEHLVDVPVGVVVGEDRAGDVGAARRTRRGSARRSRSRRRRSTGRRSRRRSRRCPSAATCRA